MADYSKDFKIAAGHVWLNAASEGPIPNVAAEALTEAMEWKRSVHLLTNERFQQVPLELRHSLSRVLQVSAEDIILGNSATYGIQLLANGIATEPEDEILLMCNDFPSDILPWLHLESRRVKIRQLKPKAFVLSADEIRQAIGPKTRAVCLPLVHSFSGWPLDIPAIYDICRLRGVRLVVNLSQAAGVLDVRLSQVPADAVVCAGYKWLLGPYGTGFCWVDPLWRRELNCPQAYWISLLGSYDLNSEGPLHLSKSESARKYDVFATANFFNYVPWQASVEYLLGLGLDVVRRHNRNWLDQFINGLDRQRYDILSPTDNTAQTNMVVFSYRHPQKNAQLVNQLKKDGFYPALWKGRVRVAPHLYNTPDEVEAVLKHLNSFSG